MTPTFAEWSRGQLFVYVRGRLVYKRWPSGVERVFYLPCQS